MHKPSLKIFITSFVVVLLSHLAAVGLNAQAAYKIDEIDSPRCDLSEVPPIDPPPWGKFATALHNEPALRGAIVVYGLEGTAVRYADSVRERFNNFGGVAAARLSTIYGGTAKDRRMELWVVPQGSAEPKSTFAEDAKNAREFDRYTYENGEICGSDRLPALAAFAEALKRRPEWRGYLVIRPHRKKRGVREGDTGWGYISRPQAQRRVAQDKRHLVKRFSLSAARLEAVIGDNDEWTHTELWLVPPGAALPVSGVQSLTKKR